MRDRLAGLLHAFAINCRAGAHDATDHYEDADDLISAGVTFDHPLQAPHGPDCICSVCYLRDNPS